MNSVPQPLLRNTLLSLIICSLLVALFYFWGDRAIAIWVSHENFKQYRFFEYCTYLPNLLVWSATLYYFYFAITFAARIIASSRQKKAPSQGSFLNVANSIAISIFIKDSLKYIFGRYWPNTWVNKNPSFLHDHAYGFHFFHSGTAYQSFPSGHTTVAVAAMVSIWITYPRLIWRSLAFLGALAVIIGLIGQDYHFLSDCIAGAWVGATVAMYVSACSRIS